MKLKLLDIHQKENTIISAVGVYFAAMFIPISFYFSSQQGGGSNQNDSTNIYLVVEPTNLKNMRLSNWISSPGRGEKKNG